MDLFKKKTIPKNEDITTSLGAIKVKDYRCPKCGDYHNDDNEYTIKGIKYPIIFNEYIGGNMDGSIHDWDEVHRCKECDQLYWFRNGAY
jgi:uncharacterized C2H2 Zn-finger protein